MVKSYNFFEGTQTDINRRLLRKIEALENGAYDDTELKARIKAVEDDIGSDTEEGTVKGRIKALEDAP